MKYYCYFLLVSCLLSGCLLNGDAPQTKLFETNQKIKAPTNQSIITNRFGRTSKNINDYVRGIMQDLVANMQYVSSATPLAVTSFVMLDSDYTQSNLLGNQLAESFINEIHKFGIPVIDVKASNTIKITATGDFILSRESSELATDLPILYVLVGTLVKHQGGHLVNARILAVESKAVVATAQSFLPEYISASLKSSDININDGIVF